MSDLVSRSISYYKIKRLIITLAIFVPAFLLQAAQPQSMKFSFSKDYKGWIGDFSDYPVNAENFFELAWGWENLPVSVPSQMDNSATAPLLVKGLFLSGNNHSDDLFMFVKRQITGLHPNTMYALTFSLLIESNVPTEMMGIGGSPGESVFVKVGASTNEPKKIAINDHYRLNVDKGDQSQGGKNAIVVGDLANTWVDPQDPCYFPKQLKNGDPLFVKSDEKGRLWIFVGSDSGFEGLTKFYIAEIGLNIQLAKKKVLPTD